MTNQQKQAIAKVLSMGGRKPDSFGANGNPMQLLQSFGNPPFDAQFDINISLLYFTVASGVYTPIAAAALAATLKVKLPTFLFGHTDFAAGYPKLQAQYPPQGGWVYGNIFVQGFTRGYSSFGNLDATALALLQKGDVVQVFEATTAGPVTTVALVVNRSPQVAMATLLNALSSDLFYTNLIRYNVQGEAFVSQFQNAIGTFDQTLFGKFASDTINPNSFKQPDQQQKDLIDIPAVQGIDKNTAWAMYSNYDVVNYVLSIFANGVDKLKAA